MAKDFILEKYEQFKNEDLVALLNSDRHSYTVETISIIENILQNRGEEIPVETKFDDSENEQSEEIFDLGGNIENIALELREENEKKEQKYTDRVTKMDDDEIMVKFHELAAAVVKNKKLDESNPHANFKNYQFFYNEIYENRKLKMSEDFKLNIRRANKIYFVRLFQKLRNRSILNILLGLFFLALGLYGTIISEGTSVYIGAIVVGLIQFFRGIFLLIKAYILKERM